VAEQRTRQVLREGEARRFFHGGPRGIWPRRIQPPNVTGAPSTADFGAHGVCRRDRVYVTTSLEAATIFGAMVPGGPGSVYEVEPVGEIEPDADCDHPDLSFACRWARILTETPLTDDVVATVRAALEVDDG